MNYRIDKNLKIIHKKIILNQLEKYIQDQRLFDILNKLFNSKSCSICEFNSFNKYLVNHDLFSLLFINIFFHRLDMEIWNIKNNLFNNNLNGRSFISLNNNRDNPGPIGPGESNLLLN